MIHQYVNNGYHIVLDVNSGSVHVMDGLSYQAVPLIEPVWEAWRKREQTEEAASGISAKEEQAEEISGTSAGKEQGVELPEMLLEQAAEALRELACTEAEKREIAEELLSLAQAGQLYTEDIYKNYIFDFKNRQTVVKALCLHIAHDCNLACKYCFAEEGEYHGRGR